MYYEKTVDYINWVLGAREVNNMEVDYTLGLFNLNLNFTELDIPEKIRYAFLSPTR